MTINAVLLQKWLNQSFESLWLLCSGHNGQSIKHQTAAEYGSELRSGHDYFGGYRCGETMPLEGDRII